MISLRTQLDVSASGLYRPLGKEFAKRLDEREGIRLFVKLPSWFEIDKVRCGETHFETLGVPFKVAVSADEV